MIKLLLVEKTVQEMPLSCCLNYFNILEVLLIFLEFLLFFQENSANGSILRGMSVNMSPLSSIFAVTLLTGSIK